MNLARCTTIVSVAALVLAALSALAWMADPLIGPIEWLPRAGLLAGGIALGSLVASLLWLAKRREASQLQRYLDALSRLEPGTAQNDALLENLPSLPTGHGYRRQAEQLRELLARHRQRVEELEHSRATMEIRAGRAAAQYEKIKKIFSALSEPVLAIDDYEEIVLANRSAENLFHFDSENAESRAIGQLVRCERLVELLCSSVHRKMAGDRTDEVEIADDEGGMHHFQVTATKLAENQSERCQPDLSTSGVVAVLRDIGHQKELQRRNAEFVSAVSHEMKTPLAGIKAYVELLADGDAEDRETQEEFLGVIDSQADRLQRLVENLLNLARIEAGVVKVSKEHQSLNELLEEALNVVQPSAEAKGIELTADLSPLYLGVLADRDMLLQAAINLLSNAIKYTPDGGNVTLRSRLEENGIRFEVQDTGVGLSEEDAQRVFDKFYRVKKDKNMASGTGLGLPLAKHIVEDVHRGHLTVRSALGEGSTFSITMPGAGKMDTPSKTPAASKA